MPTSAMTMPPNVLLSTTLPKFPSGVTMEIPWPIIPWQTSKKGPRTAPEFVAPHAAVDWIAFYRQVGWNVQELSSPKGGIQKGESGSLGHGISDSIGR